MYREENKSVIALREFAAWLKHMGYSKSTCSMLQGCIRDMLAYCQKGPGQVSPSDLRAFYGWLQTRPHRRRAGGLSGQYISHHVYAFRTFFNWLEASGARETNPASALKFKRPERTERQPLTRAAITELFTACRSLRDTAVLHLFYSCGLRRSEGASLNLRDVRFTENMLYVREGKGAKRRAIPLTKTVSCDLEAYYRRERQAVKGQDAFLLNSAGSRMSGDSCNRALKRIMARVPEEAGISEETSLHHLRHSIATHLLESGLPVEQVREFLGHSHLESTQVYTKVSRGQLHRL